jgi:hypothetical protein
VLFDFAAKLGIEDCLVLLDDCPEPFGLGLVGARGEALERLDDPALRVDLFGRVVGGVGGGQVIEEVPPPLRQRQIAVRASPDLISVRIVLTIVLPRAENAEVILAAVLQRHVPAAGAADGCPTEL